MGSSRHKKPLRPRRRIDLLRKGGVHRKSPGSIRKQRKRELEEELKTTDK